MSCRRMREWCLLIAFHIICFGSTFKIYLEFNNKCHLYLQLQVFIHIKAILWSKKTVAITSQFDSCLNFLGLPREHCLNCSLASLLTKHIYVLFPITMLSRSWPLFLSAEEMSKLNLSFEFYEYWQVILVPIVPKICGWIIYLWQSHRE